MESKRTSAARKLAGKIRNLALHDPLILALSGGGIEIGNVLAQELDAELDVLLIEKLHSGGRSKRASADCRAACVSGRVFM